MNDEISKQSSHMFTRFHTISERENPNASNVVFSVGWTCCAYKVALLCEEKRATSGKVEPENPAAETVPEDGVMKSPDEPPKPAKDPEILPLSKASNNKQMEQGSRVSDGFVQCFTLGQTL